MKRCAKGWGLYSVRRRAEAAKTVRSEQPQVITSACVGHVGSEREAARRKSVSCQYTLEHTGAWVRVHILS